MTEIRNGIRTVMIVSSSSFELLRELTENTIDPETTNIEDDDEVKESRTRIKIETCPPQGQMIELYFV